MKANIHPEYNTSVPVSCACGNAFTTGSTVKEIRVELCASCHPFYTGKQKLVDTARRVEKFQTRVDATKPAGERGNKKERRAKRAETKKPTAEKE